MLFLIIIIALGFYPKQDARYWKFSISAVVIQTLAHFLFNASGTLEDPTGDGLITAMVRQQTQSDSGVLYIFPIAMILAWAVPIYLVKKGYKRKKKTVEELDKTD